MYKSSDTTLEGASQYGLFIYAPLIKRLILKYITLQSFRIAAFIEKNEEILVKGSVLDPNPFTASKGAGCVIC